jgi:hypothetical protein
MTEYEHPKISWTHLLFKKEGRINRNNLLERRSDLRCG